MSRTSDEIRQLLAQKFQRESARLKSWGTKTDEKAAVSFADVVCEFVRALMAESRYRELKRVQKALDANNNSHVPHKLFAYIQERMRATKAMAKAIEGFAISKEGKRAWKPKSKRKHEHSSDDYMKLADAIMHPEKKHKHGSHRRHHRSRN